MDATHYCFRCDTTKTRQDLSQCARDETCLYACRTCGALEGVWLQPLQPAPQTRRTPLCPPSHCPCGRWCS